MPGSFQDYQKAAREGRGELIAVPLPSREAWQAMLDGYAPGCGSPVNVPGTNGGEFRCGDSLDGEQQFCPHCHA